MGGFGGPMMGGMPGMGMAMPMMHMQVDPKKARTGYVGGLTPGITQELLKRFFEEQLPLVAERPPVRGPAVETVSINSNGMYGFVEFYNNFDADISMCMDGMKLNGVQLQIRRPKNFNPPPNAKKYTIAGLISSRVPDGPHKIFLGGLPLNLMDAEVQAIAASFGQLSAFSLIKDRSGLSKGYAFFCYTDPNLTNHVCSMLNGREIHGKTVACKPANQKDMMGLEGMDSAVGMANPMNPMGGMMGMPPLPAMGMGLPGMGMGMGMPPSPATAYLQLQNMVTAQELLDDAEYKDIFEDVSNECRNFGRLINISMPRPPHPLAGVIFLQYSAPHEAQQAMNSLSGRSFSNRTIAVQFIQPHQWA